MNTLFASFVCATLLVATAFAANLPREVEEGYFPGRSGNVIFWKDSDLKNVDSLVSFIESDSKYLDSATRPEAISIYNVADVITQAFGLPSPNTYKPERTFLRTNAFQRPKANLMISVQGLGKSDLESQNLKNIKDTFGRFSAARLDDIAYPGNPLSTSVSLSTGKAPSGHGIVSESWTQPSGESIQAFSTFSSSSKNANLADILSQTFAGKSLTLSVSGRTAFSNAHCAQTTIRGSHPLWNNLCLSFNQEQGTFRNVDTPSYLDLSNSALQNTFAQPSFWASLRSRSNLISDISFSSADSTVTVTLQDGRTATFNLAEHDLVFFLELAYASQLPALLREKANTYVSDDVPDFYALTFSGVSSIAHRYSRGSVQHIAALQLVDSIVASLIEDFSNLYGRRLLTEVVLFGDRPSVSQPNEQFVSGVKQVLSENSIKFETCEFPNARAPLNAPELEKLCGQLANYASGQYNVHCTPAPLAASMLELSSRYRLMSAASTTNDFNSVSDDDKQLFQILLWLSILLILTIWAVAYNIAYMENKRDTLLYSKFNPTAGNRKNN